MRLVSKNLTVVILSFRKNRHNHRLLFGTPRLRVRRGWRRELAAFAPGDVFGFERWCGDKYGTQSWSIWVCRASDGGPVSAIPGINPGADILLEAQGKTRVKRCFAVLDSLKDNNIELASWPEHQWRILHNDLLLPPRIARAS